MFLAIRIDLPALSLPVSRRVNVHLDLSPTCGHRGPIVTYLSYILCDLEKRFGSPKLNYPI